MHLKSCMYLNKNNRVMECGKLPRVRMSRSTFSHGLTQMDNGIFEVSFGRNFDLEQYNALSVFIRVNLWLMKVNSRQKKCGWLGPH